MEMTQEGIDLIKTWEGWRGTAYWDSMGSVWTIGFGHTAAAGEPHPKSGMEITRYEGEEILRRDLRQYEKAVRDGLKVEANGNEFSAYVSLCYNIGPGAFGGSTTLRRFNSGDKPGAAEALLWWDKAGGKTVQGLASRREAERALFLRPWNDPAPPVVRPPATALALAHDLRDTLDVFIKRSTAARITADTFNDFDE